MSSLALASPRAIVARPVGMVVLETAAVVGLALAGVYARAPELVLCAGLGLATAAIAPRKAWAAPLVVLAATLAGYAVGAVNLAPILGAGAITGAAAAWLWPRPTTRLDTVNAALAGTAGAGLGLWASIHVISPTGLAGAAITAAVVALGASACLVPLILKYEPVIPSDREIRRALQPSYQPPVFRAVEMYRITAPKTPDLDTRCGLAEIVTWVLRLQITSQTLDGEIAAIPVERTRHRIDEALADDGHDAFTRERKEATAVHLKRMLAHREAMAVERGRTAALVDYALASLEESRAGIALGHHLPGEQTPERIPEVLSRLRAHAAAGEARRKTDRELLPQA